VFSSKAQEVEIEFENYRSSSRQNPVRLQDHAGDNKGGRDIATARKPEEDHPAVYEAYLEGYTGVDSSA